MQHENRRVGRRSVDLFQSRHAPLGELELRPAADHTHPLRRRGSLSLVAQHAQRVREGRHAVPAQFHVVVEAATDRMHVRVVETWNHRSPLGVNHFRGRPTLAQNLVIGSGGANLPVSDGDCFDKRRNIIGGDLGVMNYALSRHKSSFTVDWCWSSTDAMPAPNHYLCVAAAAGTTYSGNF